jgi:hypothetical protein
MMQIPISMIFRYGKKLIVLEEGGFSIFCVYFEPLRQIFEYIRLFLIYKLNAP